MAQKLAEVDIKYTLYRCISSSNTPFLQFQSRWTESWCLLRNCICPFYH